MRHYTTTQKDGGVTFKCVFCHYSVATLDYDHTKGNRRTQAAAAINQHAKETHLTQVQAAVPTKSGSRGAL